MVGGAWGTRPVTVQAQDPAASLPLITHVDFEGNTRFSDTELALQVRTRANRRFLGIPGFTWWLWLYRLGASGKLGERGGEALMTGGEAPAVLEASVVAADVERLRVFYRQEGFRRAEVAARVDTLARRDRVRITFVITPGAPTFLRRVSYEGLSGLEPAQRQRAVRSTMLRLDGTATPLHFTARSQRYSEPVLHEERRRLLTVLREAGYAAVSRDSIQAFIYPHSEDSFDVVFSIRPGPRYRFGDVHFDVTGPEEGAPPRTDTLVFAGPADSLAGGQVTIRMQDERALEAGLLLRSLQFRPGGWYDQARLLATKRRLESTGLFIFTDIVPLVADTARAEGALRLPHRIELRTRRRHQIRMETFVLQRSNVVGGPEGELGTGLGLSYENANLFGRGETFRLSSTGSLAAELSDLFAGRRDTTARALDRGLFTSAQAEVAASITYPYLFGPFRGLEQALDLYDARTRVSLSLLTARRGDLGLVIRGRGTGRFRLEMQHSQTVTSLVDLLDVSLSNPDTLTHFRKTFLDTLLSPVQDRVQQAQILEDYTQPQVNSAFRYTFRSARVNPLRRDRGYSYEASVEAGSNLMYLLDRFVYSPGTVEGSLPGLPFFRESAADSRLAYRQYVRLVGDVRRYLPLDRRTVLAVKVLGGVAHPTGRARVVPFDRRFYSGGGASVRGWGLRDLGPGAAAFVQTDSTGRPTGEVIPNLLGGDVKLEGGVELRHTVLRNTFGADWIGVVFTDAGNVWFGPRNPGFGTRLGSAPDGRFRLDRFYKELGVGAGLGVRVAWEYLVIRFDLATRVHDPGRDARGDGRHLQPHFGIGHAF